MRTLLVTMLMLAVVIGIPLAMAGPTNELSLAKSCMPDPNHADTYHCKGVHTEQASSGSTCVGAWKENANGDFQGWEGDKECVL